jgi:hypothetical protein
MLTYSAIKVDIQFKRLLSWCDKDISKIIDALTPHPYDIEKGMHAEKTISIFFVSSMTSEQLMRRLSAIFPELDSVNNYWCCECPRVIIGMNGPFDPATVAAERAWRKADFLTETNNVHYAKRGQSRI